LFKFRAHFQFPLSSFACVLFWVFAISISTCEAFFVCRVLQQVLVYKLSLANVCQSHFFFREKKNTNKNRNDKFYIHFDVHTHSRN
jgi:hypothetical protein